MISDFGAEFMPKRATRHSAGYDIVATCDMTAVPVNVALQGYYTMDTGLHLEDGDLREDEVMLILPRSSYGFKYGFRFANTVGVIDADYRDSIKMAFSVERGMLEIKKGDRIAQAIIVRYGRLPNEVEPVEERKGGIGSTGA